MGGKSPAAPEPIDASQASGEYLFGKDFANYQGVTDPMLQSKILSAEAQYRPQYAGLELQDINTYMLGSKAIDPYQTMQRVKTGGGREMNYVAPKKKSGFLGQLAKIGDPFGITSKLPGSPEYLLSEGDKMMGGGGAGGAGGLLGGESSMFDPLGAQSLIDPMGLIDKASGFKDPLGLHKFKPGTVEYQMALAKANKEMGVGTTNSKAGLVKRNGKWYTADTYEEMMVEQPGIAAQKGVIDLTSIAAEKAAEIDRKSNAAQRLQDLEMLQTYGGDTIDAARASDPYSRAIAEAQQKFAEDAYRNSGVLGFEEQRNADQQANMLGAQAGRLGGNSTIAAQMMNRQNAIAQRGQMAQQAGQQSFAMNRQFGDPVQILLGRPGSSAGMGSQFFSQAAGLAQGPQGPQLFDPNAGVNLALQNSANKSQFDASIYGAKSAMKGQIIGGALGAVGGLAMGGMCWVAREVYGVDSPSWLLFREWLTLDAPRWLHDLYAKKGEKFALWIANKPKVKKLIRWWMDGRIANHLSSK